MLIEFKCRTSPLQCSVTLLNRVICGYFHHRSSISLCPRVTTILLRVKIECTTKGTWNWKILCLCVLHRKVLTSERSCSHCATCPPQADSHLLSSSAGTSRPWTSLDTQVCLCVYIHRDELLRASVCFTHSCSGSTWINWMQVSDNVKKQPLQQVAVHFCSY